MKNRLAFMGLLFLAGCASLDKGCSSCNAESFGADWIIVQYSVQGPINCWQERNVSVSNEAHSDGIYWKTTGGHLVHVGGWYSRVQVTGNDFAGAARALGVELDRCKGGKYEVESVARRE